MVIEIDPPPMTSPDPDLETDDFDFDFGADTAKVTAGAAEIQAWRAARLGAWEPRPKGGRPGPSRRELLSGS